MAVIVRRITWVASWRLSPGGSGSMRGRTKAAKLLLPTYGVSTALTSSVTMMVPPSTTSPAPTLTLAMPCGSGALTTNMVLSRGQYATVAIYVPGSTMTPSPGRSVVKGLYPDKSTDIFRPSPLRVSSSAWQGVVVVVVRNCAETTSTPLPLARSCVADISAGTPVTPEMLKVVPRPGDRLTLGPHPAPRPSRIESAPQRASEITITCPPTDQLAQKRRAKERPRKVGGGQV